MSELHISVSEFKARCLDLFDRLNTRQLQKVIVTRRGKVVAVVTPPSSDDAQARAIHGAMSGMALVQSGTDLTAPIFDEALDADAGVFAPQEGGRP